MSNVGFSRPVAGAARGAPFPFIVMDIGGETLQGKRFLEATAPSHPVRSMDCVRNEG